ncbi:larval cuticle protein 1-like [Bombyx mandarina]|uniref:Larval cuticle protein 1-like n=1 Tax=Bombyx mandarina TaxID=7092 RepID=A0A6J2JMW5_BOMMA|nr:larval cuticle protein 1-like [Bombyx mandarina]
MRVYVGLCVALSWLTQASSAPRKPRLTVAEDDMPIYYVRNVNGSPGTYSFGYDILDPNTGNSQYRNEERYPNGTVTGSYGYVDAAGKPQRFRYVADEKGYRIFQEISHLPLVQAQTPPVRMPGDSATESSITWSRPKKKNKRKPVAQMMKSEENIDINSLRQPSFFAT